MINFFVTPFQGDIRNVQTFVDCDFNIATKFKRSDICLIQNKKQEIIICNVKVQDIPFRIPMMRISF